MKCFQILLVCLKGKNSDADHLLNEFIIKMKILIREKIDPDDYDEGAEDKDYIEDVLDLLNDQLTGDFKVDDDFNYLTREQIQLLWELKSLVDHIYPIKIPPYDYDEGEIYNMIYNKEEVSENQLKFTWKKLI